MAHRRRSGIDESYWDRLDNAAKLMPAVTTTRSPNVFRITAVLREPVERDILQKAVEKAMAIMPSFALKLHRGLFWYYFDINSEKPVVREESGYPCAPIYKGRERGFLFRVLYFRKRISFEIYHALSDGMGAMHFMQLILYCYYNIKYGDEVPEEFIRWEADKISRDFDEDSFQRASGEMEKSEKARKVEAFRLSGYRFDGDRLGALTAILPVDGILRLAKENGATLSEYLCALLIWSIYNTSYRRSSGSRPIVISMPVNLRGMFDSATLRNFFGHMNISVHPKRGDTFEMVLEATKEGFRDCLKREYFERQITGHVAIERIPGIKYVPVVIKDFVMQQIFRRAAKDYTITFSNLGRVQLPPMIEDRVERFELLIGASESHPKKMTIISYQNQAALAFSSTIEDNSVEQFMLSYLSEAGLTVTVSSNDTPAPAKVKKPKKEGKKA
ncbi:MAG: hypothetical protein E7632_03045 [Ruminococcaceae bacterium]|nr:hypothetical protein [Oscillospiraceae bacterium]